MRRVSILIAVCFVLALAIGLVGQGRDLDAIMKDIGPLWATPQTGLGAAINNPTPDYAKIAADAQKLQGLFTEAEAQFTKMKMTEAAGMAKKAAEGSGNLANEAKGGKIADAKATATSIGQCKACHAKYREPDGAGGYKLKMQ